MIQPVLDLPWWGIVLMTLAFTHVTIVAVTLYLHRAGAHRAVEMHPALNHFFRLWLWLSTAQVTREWIAVHRKHHARVETPDDPHSPQVYGLKKILFLGAYYYRREAVVQETLEKFGHGAPDDWLERNVYTPWTLMGPVVMLAINVILFGPGAGFLVWLTQILWIPIWAAGVINGVGHHTGYRTYETPDASRNIVPWGILIGGEELHNNHHAFASSAQFSARRFEFDIGWFYLRILERLKLASIKRRLPQLRVEQTKTECDDDTLSAVLGNRIQVMANFAREVLRHECHAHARGSDTSQAEKPGVLKRARKLMAREPAALDSQSRRWLDDILERHPRLQIVYTMQQNLRDLWSRNNAQPLTLEALNDWCARAENSGVESLREFSNRLKGYTMSPGT